MNFEHDEDLSRQYALALRFLREKWIGFLVEENIDVDVAMATLLSGVAFLIRYALVPASEEKIVDLVTQHLRHTLGAMTAADGAIHKGPETKQ